MGVAARPLIELYDPAGEAIAGAGGEIRLGVGVARLGSNFVETTRAERLEAEHVICALPGERIGRVVDDEVRAADPRFDIGEAMEHSPILGVHLTFDRPVMRSPNAVLVGRDTQWLFRKDAEGRMIHAVISAAADWMALSEDEIRDRVLADIHACYPDSAGAEVRSVRAVKEKLATFAPTPQFEAARPETTGPSGIILAGDFVQTGWPATMEGAARSGAMAAAAALDEPIESMLVTAHRPGALVRLLGARGLRDQDRVDVCHAIRGPR
jgi:zeta-carotene desaturase